MYSADLNVTTNMDEVVKISEKFYSDLYSDTNEQEEEGRERETAYVEVPSITKDEVRNALKGMSMGKATGEDGLTTDLIKDAGNTVISKLAQLYTSCLQQQKVPKAWKNATIVLLHKKR